MTQPLQVTNYLGQIDDSRTTLRLALETNTGQPVNFDLGAAALVELSLALLSASQQLQQLDARRVTPGETLNVFALNFKNVHIQRAENSKLAAIVETENGFFIPFTFKRDRDARWLSTSLLRATVPTLGRVASDDIFVVFPFIKRLRMRWLPKLYGIREAIRFHFVGWQSWLRSWRGRQRTQSEQKPVTQTIKFEGVVTPESRKLSLGGSITTVWEDLDGGWSASFRVELLDAKLVIYCDTDAPLPKEFATLIHRAATTAVSIISLISLRDAVGYGVHLKKARFQSGAEQNIAFYDPALAGLFHSMTSDADIMDVINSVTGDLDLIVALRDLANTITVPFTAMAYCGKAVDTIRSRFVPDGNGNPESGWAPMRNALNVSKAFLKSITDASKPVRHGNVTCNPPPEGLQEIGRRTFRVMDRYLEYRKRGNAALPISEYPLLDC